MELILDSDEIKAILLDWAIAKWGDSFNHVHIKAEYGRLSSVEFSKIAPEPQPLGPALTDPA